MKHNDIFSPLYKEFITIDWMRGVTEIHERILKQRRFHKFGNIFQKIKALNDACSGWIIVLALGILTGIATVALDSCSQLLTDLRQGVCLRSILLDRSQCCWPDQNNTRSSVYSTCHVWLRWSSLFNNDSSHFVGYIIDYFMYTILSIIYASIATLFVNFIAPFSCGTTIPEIKTLLGGFIIPGYFSAQNGVIKALGVVLVLSSGLNVGNEGAMVLVSCAIGNHIASLFSKYRLGKSKRQEVISAATATGIATSFASPVGGVLFSLEEASYYFPFKTLWRTFFSSMVASFVRINISYKYGGQGVLYYFHSLTNWKLFEIIPFIILSVAGALFGSLFIEASSCFARKRRTTFVGNYPSLEIGIVVLFTCLVSFPLNLTRMSNHQLLSELISNSDESVQNLHINNQTNITLNQGDVTNLWQLSLLLIVKTFLLIITVGLKLPTGIFLPCLAIGASFGRIIGILMHYLVRRYPSLPIFLEYCGQTNQKCVSINLYSIIGAATFLGGVTRMTVSLVVIIVELTGNLNCLLPLMISVMLTRILANFISPLGFFDRSIKDRHYPYLTNKDENHPIGNMRLLISWKIRELPTFTLFTLKSFGMTVSEIDYLLCECSFYGVPVVDHNDSTKLLGFATTKELLSNLRSSIRLNRNLSLSSLVLLCRPDDEINHFPPKSSQEITLNTICEDKSYVNLSASVDIAPICVNLDMPLEMLTGLFSKLGLRYVIVVHEGKIFDIVTKKDLLAYLELNA